MSCAPSLATRSTSGPAPAGELTPSTPFLCDALSCRLVAGICLVRQAVHERQRTRQASRGQGGAFPSCSPRCAQGAALRAALLGGESLSWRGAGPGGWFRPDRDDREAQHAARRRLEVVGLLAPVPTADEPPVEADELEA